MDYLVKELQFEGLFILTVSVLATVLIVNIIYWPIRFLIKRTKKL